MDFRHRRDEMEVDESWGTHQTTALFLRVLFWRDRQSTANVRACQRELQPREAEESGGQRGARPWAAEGRPGHTAPWTHSVVHRA